MKPLNAKVAVDSCSSSDASLLPNTWFDEIALDEISWLDRHSSLVIIIIIHVYMIVSIITLFGHLT